MTDAEFQALLDAETPEECALRDVKAQLRSVLAALNDLPADRWTLRLKSAVALCDAEHIAAAEALERDYREYLVERYGPDYEP